MSGYQAQPEVLSVNTAAPGDSIWRDVSQGNFRRQIDDLKRKNNVPGKPKVYQDKLWLKRRASSHEPSRLLPLKVEERIVNDLAFVAAARKDVKSVSAVALEEVNNSSGLMIRMAANGAIELRVIDTLTSIFGLLQDCAGKRLSREICGNEIFDKVIHLQRDRIHSRLQSRHSELQRQQDGKVPERKPLSQELQGLARRATSKKNSPVLKRKIADLAATYRQANDCVKDTEEEKEVLKNVAKQSYDFCTPDGRTIEQTVASYGFEGVHILEDKNIRQLNKIGRCWGLCKDMVEVSRKYGSVFRSIDFRPVPRYEEYNAPISNKAGRIPCHVHAEIQLLTFYGLRSFSSALQPRVVGFFITKTHGKLYPLWTVPDLAAYSQTQRLEIRRILAAMNKDIKAALAKNHKQLPHPTESFVHLRAGYLPSPVGSDLGTLQSNASPVSKPTPSGSIVDQPSFTGATKVGGLVMNKSDRLSPQHSVPTLSPPPVNVVLEPRTLDIKTPSDQPSNPSEINASLASPRSIASWEFPIQRNMSSASSFQMKVGDVILFFAIEKPSRGNVTIAKILTRDGEPSGQVVDLHALRPGEERVFAKDVDDKDMVISLRQSPDRSVQLNLGWE